MKKYNIKTNIKNADTLCSDYYTDDNIFINSINNLFTASWQLITHKSEINNIMPFTFMPDLVSEPMILTKNKMKINCLSNVCTHRGHIVCDKIKKTKSLTCRYHGRTFDLSGKFKKAVGFNGADNFPTKNDNLTNIPIKEWKDFIFISLDNKIDINPVLEDMESRVSSFPFSDLSFSKSLSNTFEINAHWAIYCENYLEGFHVPFVHKGLSKEINNLTYETVLLKNGAVQFANNNNNNNIYGYYYWIFPNIMLNFYKWGLSVNIIEPISKDKTKIRFLSYPIKGVKGLKKAISNLVTVEREDQDIVRSVQKGIRSRFYQKGRYSPLHEKGIHHFHRLLSEYI